MVEDNLVVRQGVLRNCLVVVRVEDSLVVLLVDFRTNLRLVREAMVVGISVVTVVDMKGAWQEDFHMMVLKVGQGGCCKMDN